MAELDKYMMQSARTYTCKTIGKDKEGRNILESRETYKTPIGEIEIGKWAERVEKAARADGKAELLERIKERASKLGCRELMNWKSKSMRVNACWIRHTNTGRTLK